MKAADIMTTMVVTVAADATAQEAAALMLLFVHLNCGKKPS